MGKKKDKHKEKAKPEGNGASTQLAQSKAREERRVERMLRSAGAAGELGQLLTPEHREKMTGVVTVIDLLTPDAAAATAGPATPVASTPTGSVKRPVSPDASVATPTSSKKARRKAARAARADAAAEAAHIADATHPLEAARTAADVELAGIAADLEAARESADVVAAEIAAKMKAAQEVADAAVVKMAAETEAARVAGVEAARRAVEAEEKALRERSTARLAAEEKEAARAAAEMKAAEEKKATAAAAAAEKKKAAAAAAAEKKAAAAAAAEEKAAAEKKAAAAAAAERKAAADAARKQAAAAAAEKETAAAAAAAEEKKKVAATAAAEKEAAAAAAKKEEALRLAAAKKADAQKVEDEAVANASANASTDQGTLLLSSDSDTSSGPEEMEDDPAPAPSTTPRWDLVPDTWDAPIYTNVSPPTETSRAVIALDDPSGMGVVCSALPTASITFVLMTEVPGVTTPSEIVMVSGSRAVNKRVHVSTFGLDPPTYTPPSTFNSGSEVVYVCVSADSLKEAKARVLELAKAQGAVVEDRAVFRPRKFGEEEPRARHWTHEVGLRLQAAHVHAVLRRSGDGCLMRTTERRGGYAYVPIVAEGRADAFRIAGTLGGLSLGVAHRKGWTVRCLPETEQRLRETLAKLRTKRKFLLTGAPPSITRAAFDEVMDHIGWKPSSVLRRTQTMFQGTRQLVFFIVVDSPPPKSRTWLLGGRLVCLRDADDHPTVKPPPLINRTTPASAPALATSSTPAPTSSHVPAPAPTTPVPDPAPVSASTPSETGPAVKATGLPPTSPWASIPSSVAPPQLDTVTSPTPPRNVSAGNKEGVPSGSPEVAALTELVATLKESIVGLQRTIDSQQEMISDLRTTLRLLLPQAATLTTGTAVPRDPTPGATTTHDSVWKGKGKGKKGAPPLATTSEAAVTNLGTRGRARSFAETKDLFTNGVKGRSASMGPSN
eukprot:TRINITY_DN2703_c0_g1_i3.p2 TRINITY_DN2703_c0_g1~~TRINITY_DN2703_c0_g1_i3.p2  ORF type:complete len:976 (+),score=270.00 TRINITY_DN2703_c0_g1_i3:75-2930(+)